MNNLLGRAAANAAVFGRILLALLFIVAGGMFFQSADFAFASSVIAAHGLPFSDALVVATMILQLGCGAMLLLAWKPQWAALVLLIWLIPATLLFHAFWTFPPQQVADQLFHFLKNIAIAGALLLVIGLPRHVQAPVRTQSRSLESEAKVW